MTRAYYNEFDPKAAAWLRELIKAGHITDGTVDERSINEVQPADLVGYDRVHFFAGIGGWELALKFAGWGDGQVWTGSCPCQPFSAAGKGLGITDERHLWPVFSKLIEACRPQVVFGEQVASSEVVGTKLEADFAIAVQDGQFAKANKLAKRLATTHGFSFTPRWIDGVRADMETAGYSFRFKVLGAHSVGSPHIRQRLYWMANAASLPSSEHEREPRIGSRREAGPQDSAVCGGVAERVAKSSGIGPIGRCGDCGDSEETRSGRAGFAVDSDFGRMGNTIGGRCFEHVQSDGEAKQDSSNRGSRRPNIDGSGSSIGLGNATSDGRQQRRAQPGGSIGVAGSGCSSGLGKSISTGPQRLTGNGDSGSESGWLAAESVRPTPAASDAGAWSNFDLIPCRDGKARRVESGTFPLAHGVPFRVVRLRGYGNAIVPQQAAKFIKDCQGVIP